ncbi:MAG: TIGR03032 family protein [Hyphomicrobium sp.]|nr:TIGR03032 family protein [Hyphomicrobium sp.]
MAFPIESKSPETFALTTSRGFTSWMARSGGSLAFTTYQAGKVFFLGLKPDGSQWVHERTFARSMGMAVSPDARTLLMATHYQLYRFENVLPDGQRAADRSDAVYVPRLSWITGDLDIHDVAFDTTGRPIFVNTLFGCIAAASDGASFRPLWKPSFLSKLAAEDRCHLNGMAVENGVPRYATAVSQSDVADGWRDKRTNGGIVMEVPSGAIVADGLSMPHSPRLHNGVLWVLNSGTGELGWIDTAARRFVPFAFVPGYARGLAFANNCAIVGLSLPRDNRTFQGLPLDAALQSKGTEPRCGLVMIDLSTGDTVGWVRLEGVVRELYDVAFLPGIRQPSAIGFKTDEITRLVSIDEDTN